MWEGCGQLHFIGSVTDCNCAVLVGYCKAFQKGSTLHISSEYQGNAKESTVLCQPLRQNKVTPIYMIFTGDDAMSFQLKVKYVYFHLFS